MSSYNPWHGCHKISAGCQNCFIYSMDKQFNRDSSIVTKTKNFDLPIRQNAHQKYQLKYDEGIVFTCLSSDFFIEEADQWRHEVWKMIKERADLDFFIITKRIDRFMVSLPSDWGDGYDNVIITSTIENQQCLEYRLPILLKLPIKHRQLNCEPLLEGLDFREYLSSGKIEHITVGGESGYNARVCDFDWVLNIRQQCLENNTSFTFRQTGACFRKDGKIYHIDKRLQHIQAKKSHLDFLAGGYDEKE